MKRRTRPGLPLLVVLAASCMPASTAPGPPGPAVPPGETGREAALPPGFGSLRLDEVSLDLSVDGLRIRVTPLDERITRLTAPDTWERLAAARARVESRHTVFLVAVETERPGGADFDPLDLEITRRGTTYRAVDIQPLTGGWRTGHLDQRSPQQALYLFPDDIDPTEEWAVRFGGVGNEGWGARLPQLDAERARVRARAGGSLRPRRARTS